MLSQEEDSLPVRCQFCVAKTTLAAPNGHHFVQDFEIALFSMLSVQRNNNFGPVFSKSFGS